MPCGSSFHDVKAGRAECALYGSGWQPISMHIAGSLGALVHLHAAATLQWIYRCRWNGQTQRQAEQPAFRFQGWSVTKVQQAEGAAI